MTIEQQINENMGKPIAEQRNIANDALEQCKKTILQGGAYNVHSLNLSINIISHILDNYESMSSDEKEAIMLFNKHIKRAEELMSHIIPLRKMEEQLKTKIS